MKNDNKQLLLNKELEKYEKVTIMTDEERNALHSWVTAGHSVHDNDDMAVDDHGDALDFLEVYREEKAMMQVLDSLSPEDREKCIARLKGEYTAEILLEEMQRLNFKLNAYERVLKKHHLLDEAIELMNYWKEHAPIIPKPSANEELPF